MFVHDRTAQHVGWILKLDQVHGGLHWLHSGKYRVIGKVYQMK